jgi:hypothetical protein
MAEDVIPDGIFYCSTVTHYRDVFPNGKIPRGGLKGLVNWQAGGLIGRSNRTWWPAEGPSGRAPGLQTAVHGSRAGKSKIKDQEQEGNEDRSKFCASERRQQAGALSRFIGTGATSLRRRITHAALWVGDRQELMRAL